MKDLSIIIPASRPHTLAHVLDCIHRQSTDGLDYEVVLIQEADNFDRFATLRYGPQFRIFRQGIQADNGASARDLGVREARGQYAAFWDDDNVYYPHAIATLFAAACGYDAAIVRVRHYGLVIPSGRQLKAGDVDSMCFCVKRALAVKARWADGGGRYNDFRWISTIASLTGNINYCPVIVGEHV